MPIPILLIIKSLLVFLYKSLFDKKYARDVKRPDYDSKKLVVFIILCVSLIINYLQFNVISNLVDMVLEYEKTCVIKEEKQSEVK